MDGAAASPLPSVNGQPESPDQQPQIQPSREKAWQPRKLLARFRARVSALTNWDEALPVTRDLAGDSESNDNELELARYTCDVAYVCGDATPADALFHERMTVARSAAERNVITEVYQRLRAIYSVAGSVPQRIHVRRMVRDAVNRDRSFAERLSALSEFLEGPLNDALCREQALGWLAEAGVKLHLYGSGWERHESLRQFMCGYAASEDELTNIWQTSRINLRLTRVDVNDPILAGGIRSGAFFLMRFFPEDVIERIYRPLYAFCRENDIRSDQQLRQWSNTMVRRLLAYADRTLGMNVFDVQGGFVPVLLNLGETGLNAWPGGLWNDEYDLVSFGSRDELIGLVNRYLSDAPERRRIAGAMRRTLVEREQGSSGKQSAGAEAPSSEADPLTAGDVAA